MSTQPVVLETVTMCEIANGLCSSVEVHVEPTGIRCTVDTEGDPAPLAERLGATLPAERDPSELGQFEFVPQATSALAVIAEVRAALATHCFGPTILWYVLPDDSELQVTVISDTEILLEADRLPGYDKARIARITTVLRDNLLIAGLQRAEDANVFTLTLEAPPTDTDERLELYLAIVRLFYQTT